MRSKAPGQWSQNIIELANHFTNVAFLAINTLANQAAACEKKVYERADDSYDGHEELNWSEPVCRLLDQPNDDDDFSDLMYKISQQLSLTGIALIWKPIIRENDVPGELYVLPSSSCLPWPPSPIYPNGSYLVQPYYPYGPFSTVPSYQSAAGARIPAEQVIRIKYAHPILNYDGYAVLTAIRRQIDTIDQIDTARWNTQSKGVDPSLIMTFDPKTFNPNNQPDMNRMRAQIDALYSGANNAGKIMPAPIGTTLTKLSQSPSEMAWQEGWEQLCKFAMACYGAPSVISGLSDSTSYATLYASMQQFELISLNPHLKKISSKFNSGLIKPYFGDDLFIELKGRKINDEDLQIRKYMLALQGKSLKIDELRKFLELKPLGGTAGEMMAGEIKESVHIDGNEEPNAQDPNVKRPVNHGGFKPTAGKSDALATILDRAKLNGYAKPVSNEDSDYFLNFDKRH
jgi:phage portal protein BeeE